MSRDYRKPVYMFELYGIKLLVKERKPPIMDNKTMYYVVIKDDYRYLSNLYPSKKRKSCYYFDTFKVDLGHRSQDKVFVLNVDTGNCQCIGINEDILLLYNKHKEKIIRENKNLKKTNLTL